MKRRALSLCLAVCLLAGLLVPASAAVPVLVCRMTGGPMAPVPAAEATRTTACCAVAPVLQPDGTVRLALTHPGCCDLQITAERAEQPVTVTPTVPHQAVAALLPTTAVAFTPPSFELYVRAAVGNDAPPRGPPLCSSPSRAPPFLS